MDVNPKHRWHVYEHVTNSLTPFWREVGQGHLTDWEAMNWAQAHFESGTKYRIVEIWWEPAIETIKELTKG